MANKPTQTSYVIDVSTVNGVSQTEITKTDANGKKTNAIDTMGAVGPHSTSFDALNAEAEKAKSDLRQGKLDGIETTSLKGDVARTAIVMDSDLRAAMKTVDQLTAGASDVYTIMHQQKDNTPDNTSYLIKDSVVGGMKQTDITKIDAKGKKTYAVDTVGGIGPHSNNYDALRKEADDVRSSLRKGKLGGVEVAGLDKNNDGLTALVVNSDATAASKKADALTGKMDDQIKVVHTKKSGYVPQ